jgi:DNA topoisomerase IA
MANRILCVAEKPSIAKAVANHLSNGPVTVVRKTNCMTSLTSLIPLLEKYWEPICQKLRVSIYLLPTLGELLRDNDQCSRSSAWTRF